VGQWVDVGAEGGGGAIDCFVELGNQNKQHFECEDFGDKFLC
jgi:hypothetical protein